MTLVWAITNSAVFLVLGAFLGQYIGRPRLTLTGHGGAGGREYRRCHVNLSNRRALLGIRLGSTTILGREIHSGGTWGLPVDRRPARECAAQLLDAVTMQRIAPLYWLSQSDSDAVALRVTMNTDETYSLLTFARVASDPTSYFVYSPTSENDTTPRVPGEEARFAGARKFIIQVTHSGTHRRIRIPIEVTLDIVHERLSWRISGGGGGSF